MNKEVRLAFYANSKAMEKINSMMEDMATCKHRDDMIELGTDIATAGTLLSHVVDGEFETVTVIKGPSLARAISEETGYDFNVCKKVLKKACDLLDFVYSEEEEDD